MRERRPPRVLLVDNYDSFTHNVAHLLGALGGDVFVIRNDDERLNASFVQSFDGIVIGPGPGRPAGAGRSLDAIGWACALRRPVFGVCLGHAGDRRVLRRPGRSRAAPDAR